LNTNWFEILLYYHILSYIIYILLPLTPHQSLSKHFTSSQLIQPPRPKKIHAFHWNPRRTPQSLSQLSLAQEMFAKLLGVSDLENCSYMLYLIHIYIYHIIYISHYNHYISHHPAIIYNQCLKVKRLAISYDHQMCKQRSISATMWPRGIGGQHVRRTKSMEYQECRFLMRIEALETMSLQSLRRFNICDSRVHFRASPVWRHTGAWQLCAVRFAGQRLWGLRAKLCALKLSQEICTLAIRLVVSPDPSTSWDSSPNCGWTSTKHIYINRIIHNEH